MTPRQVLVVNDAPEIRNHYRDRLDDEGYRVTPCLLGAVGVHGAVVAVTPARPHIVVLNGQVVPDAPGVRLVRRLRLERATVERPIVPSTAEVRSLGVLWPHLREQRVGLVRKPFDIDVLLHRIARATHDDRRAFHPMVHFPAIRV